MRPLLGWHRWTPISVRHYRDVSFGDPGTKRSEVLYGRGRRVKVRHMDGWWTLPELRGARPEVSAQRSSPIPLPEESK